MRLFSKVFDWKKWMKRLLYLFAIFIAFTFMVDFYVTSKTDNFIYSSIENTPKQKVALLLGTSKLLKGNRANQYYENRLRATMQLWKAGKFERLIISGDNSHVGYNEPEDMRKDLIQRGLPSEIIYLDYAGFSTYESVVRADLIFSQDSFLVISQEFHVQRAVYIGRYLDKKALGFCAKDVKSFGGFKTKVREKMARIKMLFDLWFSVEPSFKGDKVNIS